MRGNLGQRNRPRTAQIQGFIPLTARAHLRSVDWLEVHHLSYARLGHEHDEDLYVVCRSCHSDLHGYPRELTEEKEVEALLDDVPF